MHLFGNMFALWMFGARLENLWGPKRFLTFYFLCGIGAALIQLLSLWLQYSELLNQFMAIKLHPTSDAMIAFYQQFGLDNNQRSVEILQNYLDNPDNPITLQRAVDRISQASYDMIGHATIGASGAVFGILAAFIYLYPNTYIYLYFLFPIKTKWIGLLYFGTEIYSGIVNNAGDNIAHWAHIGGGLVGFLLVITWNRRNRRNFY
jgi:membrane associated rhomboid family serine protease